VVARRRTRPTALRNARGRRPELARGKSPSHNPPEPPYMPQTNKWLEGASGTGPGLGGVRRPACRQVRVGVTVRATVRARAKVATAQGSACWAWGQG
jgi:hypothetical protein